MKDKEVRELLREFAERFPLSEAWLRSARVVDELPVEKGKVFFADGVPVILRKPEGLFPTLKFLQVIDTLAKVVVDMGAVAHLANGAQLMRPGIKGFEKDFRKGDLVVIVDEKFHKAIALGLAEVDSESMKSLSKGLVISNIHYVGDEFWKAFSPPSAS
jgi:PUA-domain protein